MESNQTNLIHQLMTVPEDELESLLEQYYVQGKLSQSLLQELKNQLATQAPRDHNQLQRYRQIFSKVLLLTASQLSIIAWAKWGLSLVEAFAQNLGQSLQLTQEAIESFLLADEPEEAGVLIANQIVNYMETEQLYEGQVFAESYEATVNKSGFASVLSRFYWHWGLLKLQGKKPEEAIRLFDLAYPHTEKLDKKTQERFLVSFASLYLELGQYDKAEDSFIERLAYCESNAEVNNTDLGVVLYRLAQLHQYTGRLAKALNYADRCVFVLSSFGHQFSFYTYAVLLLADILLQIGEYESALKVLGVVDETAQLLAQALAHLYRGIAYQGLNSTGRAEAELRFCLPMFQSENNNWYYLALLQLARVLLSQYKQAKDIGIWQEGIQLLKDVQQILPPETAQAIECLLLLADYALQQEDWDSVKQYLEATREVAEQLPHLKTVWLYLQGHGAWQRGAYQQAQSLFAEAWRLSYQIRNTLPQTSLRVSFTAQTEHVQNRLLEITWQNKDWSTFLYYSESFRSHALHETLAQEVRMLDVDEVTRKDFFAKQAAYFQACKQLQHETASMNVNDVPEATLRQSVRERYDALQTIRQTLSFTAEPIEDEQLATILSPKTICLLFQKIGNHLVIFGIDQTGRKFQEQLPTSWETIEMVLEDFLHFDFVEFQQALKGIETYYQPIDDILQPLIAKTNEIAHQLYQHLWQPIAEQMTGYEEVIIVPDSLLHHLPFCALYDGEQYLVDKHIISYAPSATAYYHAHKRAQQRVLAEQVYLVAYQGEGDLFLPHVLKEVTDIKQMVYPKGQLVPEAEVHADILPVIAPNARVLHIASHGDTQANAPLRSALLLGVGPNGRFSVYDAAQLNLHQSEMVVLSGCNTGQLISRGGESLGLTWGFMQAGAYAVLANLLPVLDVFTPPMMLAFYQTYQTTPHKAKALCLAQRQIRQQAQAAPNSFDRLLQHPYLWSPFGFYGFAGTPIL